MAAGMLAPAMLADSVEPIACESHGEHVLPAVLDPIPITFATHCSPESRYKRRH